MRIATWNINGLRARQDFVLHWLRARRPDVVALQELKCEAEHFPHEVFEAEGYRAVVHAQRAWNGVAVLSRLPLREVESGLPGQQEAGARWVAAEIGDGELTFASVYCPNGKEVGHEDFPGKLRWLDALAERIERCDPARPLVVGGDFNVCPDERDTFDEELHRGLIFHTGEERGHIRRLYDWGLVDLYRHRHPDGRAFSWWDYRAGAFHRGLGLRIDFLLATRPIAERAATVEIDREYRKKKDGLTASDHAPVWADLD